MQTTTKQNYPGLVASYNTLPMEQHFINAPDYLRISAFFNSPYFS